MASPAASGRPQTATCNASTKLNDGSRRAESTAANSPGPTAPSTEGPVAVPLQRACQHLGRGAAALPVAGDHLVSGAGQARRCDQAGQAAAEERVEGAARRDQGQERAHRPRRNAVTRGWAGSAATSEQ